MEDKMAQQDFCLKCEAAVWKAQVCGFSVVADCTPVSIETEVLCYYAKRKTYGVLRWRPSFYLELRYGKKYGKKYDIVLAQHQCYTPQAARLHPDYWESKLPITISF